MKFGNILTYVLMLCMVACANPGSGPDGGPYDETPPKIVAMSPALGDTNQTAKKVTITFDELIKVENAQEKVIISPPQIEMPEIKTSGRHISVELLDTMKRNTTYTIDFSDAIVDSNEGNPLGNFTYYFSTGARLDTMEVAGYVLRAEDLEPVKGILVGLHSNLDDSAFVSLPLERVARTNGDGHFSIKGVAPGKYRVYALKDMDNDFRYVRGEMLAFSRDTIVPSSFVDVRHDTLWADTVHIDTIKTVKYTHFTPDNVVLLAFSEKNRTRQLLKTQREPEYIRMFFTAPSKHIPQIRGLNFDATDAFVEDRTAGNDTITYWLRDTTLVNTDSLTLAYTYEATDDSTGVNYLKTDTIDCVPRFSYEKRMKFKQEDYEKWKKKQEKRRKRGHLKEEPYPVTPLNIKYKLQSTFSPLDNIHIMLPEPAQRLDTSAIHLYLKVDSTYKEVPFRLKRDSLSLLNYTLYGEWRPQQEYVLNVDSACITGLSEKVNRSFDAKFSIAKLETYGSLFLLLPDADSTGIVQLLGNGGKIERQLPVKDGRADFFYVSPGKYYLRMLNDRNQNGKWDEGAYTEGLQAEEIYYFPQSIDVRANWDIEQTWNIHALPIDSQKPRELIKQKAEAKKTPRNRNAERERAKRGS